MSLTHARALRLLNARLKRQRQQQSLSKLTEEVGNALLKAAYGSWGPGSTAVVGITPQGDLKTLKFSHGS